MQPGREVEQSLPMVAPPAPRSTAGLALREREPILAAEPDARDLALFTPMPEPGVPPKPEREGGKGRERESRRDAAQVVAERLVEMIEKGTVPWRLPYSVQGQSLFPVRATGERYRGINTLVLMCEAHERGFQSNQWLTFRQALAQGGAVRKGEHGTPVIFVKPLEVPDREKAKAQDRPEGEKDTRLILLYRTYTVFNRDQVEGLPEPEPRTAVSADVAAERSAAIQAGYRNGPVVTHALSALTQGQAYYSPRLDRVNLPEPHLFRSPEAYHATLFHELVHSTGAAHRLARPGVADLGQYDEHRQRYAKEELIAEVGSFLLRQEAGLDSPAEDDQSAAYVKGWLAPLRNDPKFIVQAASEAEKAVEHILDRRNPGAAEES